MFRDRKIVVVMPAYNAGKTLKKTYDAVMEQGIVDTVIIVDDASLDNTVDIAELFPSTVVYKHKKNLGYGANQKSCYKLALEVGADIVIMVHPDYQYTPKLIPAMVAIIGNDLYPCVLGSRVLGGYALRDGMPLWRYVANRVLTMIENLLMGAKLSEFHTGYRAFSRHLLEKLPLEVNSNDFVFDNQILAQILWLGFPIAEVTCPSKYFAGASSINVYRSMKYGMGCICTAVKYRFAKMKIFSSKLFPKTMGQGSRSYGTVLQPKKQS